MSSIWLSVVSQEYTTYISPVQVIRGNDVLVKCDIPSFVTDFVSVAEWVDNEGEIYSSHRIQGNFQEQTDIKLI